MASRSFHDLLLRARDHFAGSSHWTYLAVLALALIHALVVTPFIAGSRLESETSLQRTRLAAVESSLGELRGALEAVRQETSSMVAPALERLIEDLEGDLARLDVTRRQIAARAAADRAEAGAADAPPAAGTPAAGSPAAGTPLPAESNVQPFLIDDPDRIADLRDARTPEELLAALAPVVDELIARPRYFDLDRGWRDDALPRLEARLDTAASALPRLRSRFPEARSQWQALAGSLNGLSSTARELRFEPPAQPYWWNRSDRLPASGGDSFASGALSRLPASGGTNAGVDLGLTPAVVDEIRRPRRLAELEAAADRSVESYSEIVGKVAQAKRELGDPATGAFDWLDIGAVAMFPLLVGLVIGGAMTWRSQRLRELGLVTHLAVEHGGPPALKRWFWSQVQWNTPAGRSAATTWHACVTQTLLGYFLAMSWIALAAVQLRQLAAGHQRLMIYTITGAVVVLLAVVHRLLVGRRAIMALDDVHYEDEIDEGERLGEHGTDRRGSSPEAAAGDDPEPGDPEPDDPDRDAPDPDTLDRDAPEPDAPDRNDPDRDEGFLDVAPLRR